MSVIQEVNQHFYYALLSIDKLSAREILNESCNKDGVVKGIEKTVIPALEKIGLQWNDGTVSLSQVYMAGRICEELVDQLLTPASPDRKNIPSMAIAVLEDYHFLGKRIVYSVLRSAGYELLDYGHITARELADRVKEDKIKIIFISVLMFPSALKVKEFTELIKKEKYQVRVFVGGAPFLFDANLWKEVGADAMGKNSSDAIALIEKYKEGCL